MIKTATTSIADHVAVLDRARTLLALSPTEIAGALQANLSTVHRWRAATSHPTGAYADRLRALDGLISVARLSARGTNAIRRWLDTSDPVLDGQTPRMMIRAGRCDFLLGILTARAAAGPSEPSVTMAGAHRPTGAIGSESVKLLSVRGRLIAMSAPGGRLLGITRVADVIGQRWTSLWPRSMTARVRAAVRQAAAGEVARFQGDCRTTTGGARWFDVIVTPVYSEDGTVDHLVAVSRDVTAEHLAGVQMEKFNATARETTRRAVVLGETAALLAGLGSVRDIAEALVTQALPRLGAVAGLVAVDADLVDGGVPKPTLVPETLAIAAAANMPAASTSAWRRYPVTMDAPMADATRTGQVVVLSGQAAMTERYPEGRSLYESNGLHALCAVPIVAENRRLGGAVFLWSDDRSIDEGDVLFIRAIADQGGAALDLARLQRTVPATAAFAKADDVRTA